MRVTANTFPDALVQQLTRLTARQSQLQQQAATGQRVRLPEDDPSAVNRTLQLQAEAKAVAQYRRNIAALKEQSLSVYEVLRGLKRVSDRVGELAITADGTRSPEDLKVIAAEVTQLIRQAVQSANGKFRGNYLLSGTKTDQPPFVVETDADGRVTAVRYQGNTELAESELAEGVTVAPLAVGENTSGAGPRGIITDPRFGADFFNHLISFQNHLLAGDTEAIANEDRPALAADEENLVAHIGNNAALQARLEAAESLAAKRSEALEIGVSREVDADLAETLVRLTQTQTAYQAALQSGARLLQTNLLDYIR